MSYISLSNPYIIHNLRVLQLTLRLQQFAKNRGCNRRIKNGKLRHVADAPTWKYVDDTWEKIKEDPRNLRLGLLADGINPHSSLSSNYNYWSVSLVIYNLPPLLIMKRRFPMLTLLTSGPRQSGNVDIIDIGT